MDAMRSEFDGLEAAGTFVEVSELPASSNIVVKVALEVEERRARHE